MGRLTKRHDKGIASNERKVMPCSNYCDSCGNADCDTVRKMIRKLADYEDLEEKGLLIRLPCQLGRTLYVFDVLTGLVETKLKEYNRVPYFGDNMIFEINGENVAFPLTDIGKSVFFTRREAEEKIKEMEGRN